MAEPSFTPAQMEKLLAYAGQRLGTTPDKLKEVFQREGLAGLSDFAASAGKGEGLSPQAQALLQDKEKTAALLNDPAVRRLLAQLLG